MYDRSEGSNVKMYSGSWMNGKHHGKGRAVYPDDSVYEGDFNEGVREGKGIYTFNKIFKYQG